jgi:hypothetical protein
MDTRGLKGGGVKRNAKGIFPMGKILEVRLRLIACAVKSRGPLIAGGVLNQNKMAAVSSSLANWGTKVGTRVPTRPGGADVVFRAARDSRPYLEVREASGL